MPSQPSDQRSAKGGLYQCSQCQRRYHRSEHLARHVRSHTRQRPYSCEFCGKSFARLDVLKRHESTHGSQARPVQRSESLRRMFERVNQACRLCSTAKAKCSEQKPCHRCVAKGLHCEYSSDCEEHDQDEILQEPPQDSVLDRSYEQETDLNDVIDTGASGLGPKLQPPASVLPGVSEHMAPGFQQVSSSIDTFGFALYHPMEFPDMLAMLPQNPQTIEDFSFGPDWDMNTPDFSTLQAQFDEANTQNTGLVNPDDVGISHVSDISLPVADNFERAEPTHSWQCQPQPGDNSEMERRHLAASDEGFRVGRNLGSLSVSNLSLSATSRNSIVSMILETTSRADAAQILGTFPSIEALNTLLNIYVTEWETSKVEDIVHVPTVCPESERPELLGAMIASGAVRAGSSVARKFGFAMQEVVRTASFRAWEKNNVDFRDLSLSQAFFLQQHIAFFSGSRRKVAVAEGLSKCLQVLIRNGGHLQGAIEAREFDAVGLDNADELDVAWKRWITREAQRRLVYAAYIMDSHVSMSQGGQIISFYLDMDVPFPYPRTVWKAKSALEWKTQMLSTEASKNLRSLNLRIIMGDPTLISQKHAPIDTDVLVSGFLAGIWALIKECLQLTCISGSGSIWSTMILSSRRVELMSMLKLFHAQVAHLERPPEVDILSEALAVQALMSTDNLALRELVRPESHDTARVPAHEFGSNPQSVEYRSSLWRAGRAVRAASRCSPGVLCRVYATALFQVSVLLWRHSLVLLKSQEDMSSLLEDAYICVLDDEETLEHHVLDSRARLMLRGKGDNPVPLESPSELISCVKGLFEKNWGNGEMPPDTEDLCRALTNLGKVAALAASATARRQVTVRQSN